MYVIKKTTIYPDGVKYSNYLGKWNMVYDPNYDDEIYLNHFLKFGAYRKKADADRAADGYTSDFEHFKGAKMIPSIDIFEVVEW